MRQAGHIAAAGLISLEKMVDRLQVDHNRAQKIAAAIASFKSPFFRVDMKGVHTNIIMIDLETDRVPPEKFCRRLVSTTEAEKKEIGQIVYVRMFPFGHSVARAVLNNNLTEEDVELVIAKLKYYSQELQAN